MTICHTHAYSMSIHFHFRLIFISIFGAQPKNKTKSMWFMCHNFGRFLLLLQYQYVNARSHTHTYENQSTQKPLLIAYFINEKFTHRHTHNACFVSRFFFYAMQLREKFSIRESNGKSRSKRKQLPPQGNRKMTYAIWIKFLLLLLFVSPPNGSVSGPI